MHDAARLLASEYDEQRYWLSDPVDVLIATLLSQATTDTNSQRAFKRLKNRFPEWRDVLDADVGEIAEIIGPAGLGPTRARRIKEIIARIVADYGDRLLMPLANKDLDEVMNYLQSLPGIGPKTAACTALFAFDLPIVPVDVHIARVGSRLGLLPQSANTDAQQQILTALVTPERMVSFHLHLIAHGRKVCRPTKPKCTSCIVKGLCSYERPD